MTVQESIKLAKLGQKVDDLKEDVASIKEGQEKMNNKIDDFIKSANETFLTVSQAKLLAWVVGSIIGVSTVVIGFLSYIKGH